MANIRAIASNNIMISPVLLLIVINLSIIFPTSPLFNLTIDTAHAGSDNELPLLAEDRWREIYPEVNLFLREMEDVPSLARRHAWKIIRLLKGFIYNYPRSHKVPEAYYIVGLAYKHVGFLPEAISHWRIAAKKFTGTKWADLSLLQIMYYYDETGAVKKKNKFLREIIRQYPDTIAAKTAWVSIAIDMVKQGKDIDFIDGQVRRLEKAVPNISVDVPLYLELKARLKEARGDYKGAIPYWLHYLNLTPHLERQALTLFELGEAYRKLKLSLKARKYYALCAREHRRTSYALFSQFRLAQLREQAQKVAPWRMPKEKKEGAEISSLLLYERIVREYPRHPITQEVELEFARLRVRRDDPVGAINLIKMFFLGNPESNLKEAFLKVAKDIRELMEKKRGDEALLRNYLGASLKIADESILNKSIPDFDKTSRIIWRHLIENLTKNNKLSDAADEIRLLYERFPDAKGFVQEVWKDFIAQLLLKKRFLFTINEAKSLQDTFLSYGDTQRFAIKKKQEALRQYFSMLLKKEEPMTLLNYFYDNMDKIKDALLREHLYKIARAWSMLYCLDEAGLYFGRAYIQKNPPPPDFEVLTNWLDMLVASHDFDNAKMIMEILEDKFIEKLDPYYYHIKSQYGLNAMDWEAAYSAASKGLSLMPKGRLRLDLMADLIKASTRLSMWDVARNTFRELDREIGDETRKSILTYWADNALRLKEYEEAFTIYNMLMELDPKDIKAQFKMALALLQQGRKDEAVTMLKAISSDSSLWGKAAKTLIDNGAFWDRLPKDIRSAVMEK